MINPLDSTLKINVQLFRDIQQMILKHPEAFDMSDFWGTDGYMRFDPRTMIEPNCGSACCIGGWAVILGDKMSLSEFAEGYLSDVRYRAQTLLGLTDRQADWIFMFSAEYGLENIDKVTAQEASDMIDRFLADPSVKP